MSTGVATVSRRPSSLALSITPPDDLALHLVPAIARQATLKVVGARPTQVTARVVAGALRAMGLPAGLIRVQVAAYSAQAWGSQDPTGAATSCSSSGAHWCVQSGSVLLDACLDLLSVPGGSLSLRPSWFDLPRTWDLDGYASFCQQQTGAVVSYLATPLTDEISEDDGSAAVLIDRLVAEVVELCGKAQRVLAGMQRAPARWVPLAD